MATRLEGGRLIDCSGNPPVEDAVVVVDGDRIAWAGRAQVAPRPHPNDHIVDAAGLTLLPGLINAHEHLSLKRTYGPYDSIGRGPVGQQLLRCVQSGLLSLSEGITTVRDCGAKDHIILEFKRGVEDKLVIAPRVFSCGHPIVPESGAPGLMTEASTPEELTATVGRLVDAGADFIKIKPAASNAWRGLADDARLDPQFNLSALKAGYAVATNAGRRVTSHASHTTAILDSIEAGAQCIEHGLDTRPHVARRMAELGVAFVPSATNYYQLGHFPDRWGMAPSSVDMLKATWDTLMGSVRNAIEAGVMLATGTDFRGSVAEEVRMFRQAGLGAMESLQAATINGARILGKESDLGTLEAGKLADLIAVSGDPLKGAHALEVVDFVMLAGTIRTASDYRRMQPNQS